MSHEEEKLQILKTEELKASIRRVQNLMTAAQRRNIEIDNNVTEPHDEAVRALARGDETSANIKAAQAWRELGKTVSNANRSSRYQYYFMAYGGPSRIIAGIMLVSLLLGAFFLYYCQPAWKEVPINEGLTIPLWTFIMGGMGAAIQIIKRITMDLRNYGILFRHETVYHFLLPGIGMIFGLVMYLFIKAGILFNFEVNNGSPTIYFQMLLCFLAGYSTDWFMERLETFVGRI